MSLQNKKSLGQHWLYNREILDTIAASANSKQFINTCLEIGPGLGTLTSSLFKHFNQIIAVELDHRLAANLPKSFPGKNLQVIEQDFLDFDLSQISQPYVVAGNIPYYITSPIITKLLTAKNPPQRIVLLIQKEVAQRLATPHSSFAALQVQNLAAIELGVEVPRTLFTPPPKVDSQVIILTPHEPLISLDALKLAKLGFAAPRKKLISNLAAADLTKGEARELLLRINLSPDARPADLTLANWEELATFLLSR